MNDIRITLILPNRDEDKDDIAYIVSRIIEKSGIDNFIADTKALEIENEDEWLAKCMFSAEPHYMFDMSGDAYIGITGLCSECGEHTEFKEYGDDDE